MIGDVVVEGVLGVVGVHLVEGVGQMAGIGHLAVVGRPTAGITSYKNEYLLKYEFLVKVNHSFSAFIRLLLALDWFSF